MKLITSYILNINNPFYISKVNSLGTLTPYYWMLLGSLFVASMVQFIVIIWIKHTRSIHVLKIISNTAILFLASSIFYYSYTENIFGTKKTIQNSMMLFQKSDTVSRSTIKRMVMRNTTTNLKKQGFISIPSLDILLPIYNDAYSNRGLNAGANYANRSEMDPEGLQIPKMGKGNYGLAAHNFNDGITGFSSLQEKRNNDLPYLINGKTGTSHWLKGTKVYMADEVGIYEYQILKQTVVLKTNVSVLNPKGDTRLTIISCLFPSTEYRIITIALLDNSYSWETAPASIVNLFNLHVKNTNARANWWNPGTEEGANGDHGGL